jgi:hypothetical protein
MKKPAGVPVAAIGVGVAVSLRAGVRIGMYPAQKRMIRNKSINVKHSNVSLKKLVIKLNIYEKG